MEDSGRTVLKGGIGTDGGHRGKVRGSTLAIRRGRKKARVAGSTGKTGGPALAGPFLLFFLHFLNRENPVAAFLRE